MRLPSTTIATNAMRKSAARSCGSIPGARELPQLPRSARLDQRLPAEDLAAAAVPAVPRQSCRAPRQSTKSAVDLRIQPRVSELPLAAPWFEQPVGVPVPPLRGEHRTRRKQGITGVG